MWKFKSFNATRSKDISICSNGSACHEDATSPEFSGISFSADGDLHIRRILRRHHGTFRCTGLLGLSSATAEQHVAVLAPPKTPQVTPADSATLGDVAEGTRLRLRCLAAGANPPPLIGWRLRQSAADADDPLTPDPPATEAVDTPFAQVVSFVTFRVDRRHHGAAVTCRAHNSVGNSTSPPAVLSVLYKPTVSAPADVSVVKGRETLLQCTASGNPEPKVHLSNSAGEWLSGESSGIASHLLRASSKWQSGQYSCVASNSQGSSSANFSVSVLYPPAVTAPATATGLEGDELTVACSVDARPPATSVMWRHAATATEAPATAAGGQRLLLLLRPLRRRHAGNWSCVATSQWLSAAGGGLRTAAASTRVIVQYRPAAPSVAASRGRVIRGQTVSMACDADRDRPGVPSPTFLWSKAGDADFSASGPTLRLPNVSLEQAGRYGCVASNSVGSSAAATADLVVEQPPDWLAPQPGRPISARVNDTDLLAECSALALPPAEVSWYKDGQLADKDLYTVQTEVVRHSSGGQITKSTLHFAGRSRSSLLPQDNGQFVCEAKNRHGKISATIPVQVKFAPRIEATQSKVALAEGGHVTLSCSAIGQPAPRLSWSRADGETAAGDPETSAGDPEAAVAGSVPYRRVARLGGVSRHGSFVCEASNEVGADRRRFRVVPPSPPEPPTELRAVAVGWDFVTLRWRPGFDGGSVAKFWVHVVGDGDVEEEERRRSDTADMANVTGLVPSTNYSLRVSASNANGDGNSTRALALTTTALALPSPTRVRVTDDNILRVTALAGYCLRVEASDDAGASWSLLHFCADSGSGEIAGVDARLLYRVSLCLRHRHRVCGSPRLSTDSMSSLPEIPTSTIAIVGGCCVGLILLLSTVLLYFCCKRPRAYKEMQQADSRPPGVQQQQQQQQQQYQTSDGKPYALVPPHPSASADNISGGKAPSRRDSAVKSNDEGVESGSDRRSSVFATLRSGHNPLDSSASNPAIFTFAHEYSDDVGTESYSFDPGRQRRIVYEVVV